MKTSKYAETNRAYYLKNRDKILKKQKEYYRQNKELIKLRKKLDNIANSTYKRRSLKSKFGLTLEEYSAMLIAQNYACAICKLTCKSGRDLAVDHNHKNNSVRGLLCGKCNMALGLLDDNIDVLKSAIIYLGEE